MLSRSLLPIGRSTLNRSIASTSKNLPFRCFTTKDKEEEGGKKSKQKEEEEESGSNGVGRRRDELQRIRDELPVTFADISRYVL